MEHGIVPIVHEVGRLALALLPLVALAILVEVLIVQVHEEVGFALGPLGCEG